MTGPRCAWCHSGEEVRRFRDIETGESSWICFTCYETEVVQGDDLINPWTEHPHWEIRYCDICEGKIGHEVRTRKYHDTGMMSWCLGCGAGWGYEMVPAKTIEVGDRIRSGIVPEIHPTRTIHEVLKVDGIAVEGIRFQIRMKPGVWTLWCPDQEIEKVK